MKKILHFIFLIIPIIVMGQNWTLVNSNTTSNIRDMYFKDGILGFFLTNMGEIYKTTDGGDNWEIIYQDTDFVNDTNPNYTHTAKTSIVTTNDSLFCYYNYIYSESNLQKSVRIKSHLSTVSFTKDTLDHWMSDPRFYNNDIWSVHKVNQLLESGATTVQYYNITNNYISASNSTKIYYSNDLGANWQNSQFTSNPMNSPPYQSYYNGTDNIIAITNYPTTVYKTTDGNNWEWNQPVYTNPEADGLLFYFVDFNNYLAYNFFGSNSKIYRSDDGGQTFSSEDLTDVPLGIYSVNNTNEVIFLYGKNGMLYKTTNAGGLSTDYFQLNSIKTYPNPSKGIVNIDFPVGVDVRNIQIINLQGKIVKRYNEITHNIDVRGMEKGTYVIVITTQKGTQSQKIVIE